MRKALTIVFVYIFGFFIFYTIIRQFNILKLFENDKEIHGYQSKFLIKKAKYIHSTFTKITPDENSSPLTLSKEQLGQLTWPLLHSVAASYPKIPNEEDKKQISNFLHSLSYLYPCQICRSHFKKMLEKYPVKNDSREDLVNYLCYLHNKVNKRLNKPIFDCKEAFKFWGGECGCSEKSNTTSTSTNSTTNNTESNLK